MLRIDLDTPLYPVDPTISRGDFERLIMGEPYEVAGVFGEDGRLVLAPKRGGLDAVEFTEEESPYLHGCVLTHNHPSGSAFSYDDMALSAQRDVGELRAVCPDGIVYVLERPLGGWPSTETMLEIVDRSIKALRAENERGDSPVRLYSEAEEGTRS